MFVAAAPAEGLLAAEGGCARDPAGCGCSGETSAQRRRSILYRTDRSDLQAPEEHLGAEQQFIIIYQTVYQQLLIAWDCF